jgi:hypothetical protein
MAEINNVKQESKKLEGHCKENKAKTTDLPARSTRFISAFFSISLPAAFFCFWMNLSTAKKEHSGFHETVGVQAEVPNSS